MKKIFYFNRPIAFSRWNRKISIRKNTYSIHHFAMSWISKKDRFLPDLKKKANANLIYKTLEKLIKIMRLKEIKIKFLDNENIISYRPNLSAWWDEKYFVLASYSNVFIWQKTLSASSLYYHNGNYKEIINFILFFF